MGEETKEFAQKLLAQEIFAVGKWNGDPYTEADLDAMVSAFHSLNNKVPLKLGHTEAQKWFGQKDGAPALGWLANVRRIGEKLVGDFENVPDAIAKLIANRNYRTKSAEVYWNFPDSSGKNWPRVLKAVSLLGADLPAVTTLNDLTVALNSANYSISSPTITWTDANGSSGTVSAPKWKEYQWERKTEETMTAEQEKVYTDKIASLEKKVADEAKRADDAEARAVKVEAQLSERDEKFAVEQFASKIDSFVKEGKVLPGEKDTLIRQFVALGKGTKKYGEKEFNPREELIASLEARGKKPLFGQTGKGGESTSEENPPVLEVDRLAKKYSADLKGSYNDGLKKVKEDHPDLWARYITDDKGDK